MVLIAFSARVGQRRALADYLEHQRAFESRMKCTSTGGTHISYRLKERLH